MKLIKIIFLILVLSIAGKMNAQDKLVLKTTELYILEMPMTYGDYERRDFFLLGVLILKTKKLKY